MEYIKIDKKVFELKIKKSNLSSCQECDAYTKNRNCLVDKIFVSPIEISKCNFFSKKTKLIEVTNAKEKIKLLISKETKTLKFYDLINQKEENEKCINIKSEN